MNFVAKSTCVLVFVFLSACSKLEPNVGKKSIELEVFKSPTCGCCKLWVGHLKDAGFAPEVRNHNSFESVKRKLGVPKHLQSCHTGVSDSGYFFEGHIPPKFVAAFLDNPPMDAIGLAVPGMPAGSPGMEMGDKFEPYSIMLVKKDGSSEVYADVASFEEQYE
ncbi:MAG: DUF411 domain-containing protein [Agarilytica sp.]